MAESMNSRLTSLLRFLPAITAILLVGIIYSVHVYYTFRYEHLNPSSNGEEWAYTNIAANNFLQHGFLNSLFLQDHSSSPYPEDHPYVYNHMPAGAENVTAVLLAITNHDYQLTRFFFAIFVLPGLYFFIKFVSLLFDRISLRGAPLVLLTISPVTILSHMEAQIHSVFLFLGFAPIVLLIKNAESGGRWRLWLAGVGLFIFAIYVQYVLVAAIVFAVFYLWAFKLVKLRFMHVALVVGAVAMAVIAHLLQNLLYFGPEIFLKELMYTLGNRTIGIPTKEELKDFYQAISVVHHGSRSINIRQIIASIFHVFQFPHWSYIFALISMSAALFFVMLVRDSSTKNGYLPSDFIGRIRYITRLYLWAAFTIVSVILVFPAFAQDVNLGGYGVDHLLLGIPSIALILTAIDLGHGREMFSDCCDDKFASWKWILLYAIILLAILHFSQFKFWVGIDVQIFVVGIFIFCVVWSWVASLGEDLSVMASVSHPNQKVSGFFRIAIFLAGFMTFSILVMGVATQSVNLLSDATKPSYLEPLKDLKQFHNKLFLTNINLPLVGFFANGPGYGVCGLEAIGRNGQIDSSECKISFVRRKAYWDSQRPDLFIFFWSKQVFPGFSDCQPISNQLPVGMAAQETCIGKLHTRLKTNFKLLYSNQLFEVYDLNAKQALTR